MNLTRLREQTAQQHSGTEETVPLMRSDLTRAQYGETLRRFHCIVSAWDRWADEHAPADLLPLLKGRRRASLLADDLQSIGEGVPDSGARGWMEEAMRQTAVAGDPRSVFLGRMYVMEGSTLGGQYIAKHLEEHFGIARGQGNSFFVGYGEETAVRWREFRAVLQQLPDDQEETVIASAKNMFSLFGDAMRGPDEAAGQGHMQPPDGGGASE